MPVPLTFRLPSGKTILVAAFLTILSLVASDYRRLYSHSSSSTFPTNSTFSQLARTANHHSPVNATTRVLTGIFKKISQLPQRVLNLSSPGSSSERRSFPGPFLFRRSRRAFLPPSFYETYRGGAIEVFEKHGMTICRIYRICRLRNGHLQAPTWMANHSSLLTSKCGLTGVRYEPTHTLRSRFGVPPHYDWIAPDVPTHALLKIVRDPLSHFFASSNAKESLLDNQAPGKRVYRTCLSKPYRNPRRRSSRICHHRPEGRITNPAFLVNLQEDEAKAGEDYRAALTAQFAELHGAEADVFDPSSALLRAAKACFRSVIATPGAGMVRGTNHGLKHSGPVNLSSISEVTLRANRTAVDEESVFSSERQTQKPPRALSSEEGAERTLPSEMDDNTTRTATARHGQGTHNKSAFPVSQKPSELPKTTKNRLDQGSHSSFVQESATLKRIRQAQQKSVLSLEGGVELFTHRTVDGVAWNRSSGIDPGRHVYGICRIYRACRCHNQTLILPAWMSRYHEDLDAHCGLSDVLYLPNSEFDVGYQQRGSENGSSGSMLQSSALYKGPRSELMLDLIGNRVYRAQEQHFMTDFFHDGIHAFDALFNQRRGRHSVFRRNCLYRPDTVVSKNVQKERLCVDLRTEVKELNPAVLLPEILKIKNRSSKYIWQLLAMINPAKETHLHTIFSEQLSPSGPKNSTCFRSIVLTRNSYPPASVFGRGEENVFFTSNNVSRMTTSAQAASRKSRQPRCKVRLAVLRPQQKKQTSTKKRQKKYLARKPFWHIQNQEELFSLLRKKATALRPRLELEIREFSDGGKTVVQAKMAVQRAEIILGVNNPVLTNIVFARPQTSIIEVQPFGYSAGPYRSFARSLNLRYSNITSMPDPEQFEDCVRENYRDDWDSVVTPTEMEAAKEKLLRLFHLAREQYDGHTTFLQLARRSTAAGNERTAGIPLERVCARSQRIRVNASIASDLILADALSYCRRSRAGSGRPSLDGRDI